MLEFFFLMVRHARINLMNWMNIHYIYDDVQVGCPTKKIFLIYCTFHLINHFFFFFFSKSLLVFKYTESNFQWIQYMCVCVYDDLYCTNQLFSNVFLSFYSKIRFKLIGNGDTRLLKKFKKKTKKDSIWLYNRSMRMTNQHTPLSIHLIYISVLYPPKYKKK